MERIEADIYDRLSKVIDPSPIGSTRRSPLIRTPI